jgi:hypothetical protein
MPIQGPDPTPIDRNAVYRAQVLAEIGRRLRESYDVRQPLPERLAGLVRKLLERQNTDCDRPDGRSQRPI